MTRLFGSVCAAALVAGGVTATAGRIERSPATSAPIRVEITINRVAKADRQAVGYSASSAVTRQDTQRADLVAFPELVACESLVSPLADRIASRRTRECAA